MLFVFISRIPRILAASVTQSIKVWSVRLTNKIPWRFHSLLRLSLYVLRTAGWSFMKVRRQKRSLESSFASICLYCLCYDLLLPGVTQGHLRNLNVHFHRAIRWMVPPVGDSLLIGCRNVWKILVGKGRGQQKYAVSNIGVWDEHRCSLQKTSSLVQNTTYYGSHNALQVAFSPHMTPTCHVWQMFPWLQLVSVHISGELKVLVCLIVIYFW